jgi:hypothetical protein
MVDDAKCGDGREVKGQRLGTLAMQDHARWTLLSERARHSNLSRLLLLTTHCYNDFARARVGPNAPSRHAASVDNRQPRPRQQIPLRTIFSPARLERRNAPALQSGCDNGPKNRLASAKIEHTKWTD